MTHRADNQHSGVSGRPRPTADRPARRLLVAALMALAGTGTLAGCGIPADPKPHAVTPPPQYESLTPAPPPTLETGTVEETLCLTRELRLVRVSRPVDQTPTPEVLLADLSAGANDEERAQGLQSAVAGITTLSVSGIENRIATVAIGESLEGLAFDNQLLIYAQIVCTLDAHPAIDGVYFSRDGERVSVPRGDGTQTQNVLTSDDYTALLEEPPR